MTGKVAIVDTSILCCWLNVPGRATAGSPPDVWDNERATREIDAALAEGFQLVMPVTSVIETGNHISHATTERFEKATEFVTFLNRASVGTEPWAPFSEQFGTLGASIGELAPNWPEAAARGVSLGDFLITSVADYYSLADFTVRIITTDQLLRSHVPLKPERKPRRRS